jgi:hypothetical protein
MHTRTHHKPFLSFSQYSSPSPQEKEERKKERKKLPPSLPSLLPFLLF